MARAWRDFQVGIEDLRTYPETYQELDHERVLVVTRYGARGEASGVGVEMRGAVLFQVGDGRVTRLIRYWSRDRALADLCLVEE
jgi:ketosteroid isomerase-like protein